MSTENLSDFTTLKVGGPAKNLVHVKSEEELIAAVRAADASKTPLLILGGGSNVLISDQGFDGTVICVETKGNSFVIDA